MSIMTRGIIGMPYKLAMNSEISRRQFYSHAQVLLADHDSAKKHWENESNNVQVLVAEVVRLKAESEALRKIATELRRWASCEHLHHEKRDQHEFDEPCKVLARIDKALSKEG